MERDDKDPVIRRRILRAVQESLAAAWQDPMWAQLEELEEDSRSPLVDVQDREDHYVLVAELPGIPKENVDVKVTGTEVEISGENALACELDAPSDVAYLCNERTVTSFQRRVSLPKPVVPEDSEAEMEHGVLVVKLPKRREEKGPAVSLKVS